MLNIDPSINYPPEIIPVPSLQWYEDDTLFVNKADWYPYVSDPNEPDSLLSFYLIPGTHLQWEKADSIFKLTGEADLFGTDSFQLVVVDWEYSDTTKLYVTITSVNDAPRFAGLSDIAFNEDQGFLFDTDDYMVDVDTDTLAVVLSSEVIGVVSKVGNTDLTIAIDSLSHEVSLSSTMDSTGVFSVVFTATDDSNAVTADTILISVNPVNDPPVVIAGIDDIYLFEDSVITLLISDLNSIFYDVEDGLNFSALAPSELGIIIRNDSLMVNSEKDFFGSSDVIVIATDSSGASVRDTFNLAGENINDLPEAFHLLTPASGDTLDSLSAVTFSWHLSFDADYDSLDYELHLFVVETESILLSTKDTTLVFNGEDALNPDADYKWFVLASDDSGFTSSTDTLVFHTPKATAIGEDITGIPEIFDLQQNYPNPFNPKTRFRYDLPRAADVKIELYNIMGQRALTLINEKKPAGYHFFDLEANSLASGLYFYVIRTSQNYKVRKMILIK